MAGDSAGEEEGGEGSLALERSGVSGGLSACSECVWLSEHYYVTTPVSDWSNYACVRLSQFTFLVC